MTESPKPKQIKPKRRPTTEELARKVFPERVQNELKSLANQQRKVKKG